MPLHVVSWFGLDDELPGRAMDVHEALVLVWVKDGLGAVAIGAPFPACMCWGGAAFVGR